MRMKKRGKIQENLMFKKKRRKFKNLIKKSRLKKSEKNFIIMILLILNLKEKYCLLFLIKKYL